MRLIPLILLAYLGGCAESDCAESACIGTEPDVSADAQGSVDASPEDAAPTDAALDGAVPADAAMSSGAPCAFNRECPANERCACDEATGCACAIGARGVGLAGDPCTTGDDCASAVCLEGPGDDLLCTEECEDASTCPEALPLCTPIAFVGQVCIRRPPE